MYNVMENELNFVAQN